MKKTFLRVCSLLLVFMLCFSMSSCAAVAALVLVGEVEMAKNTLENGLVPEVDTEWIAPTVSSTQLFKSSTLNATLVELKQTEETSLNISVRYKNTGHKDITVSSFFIVLNNYTFEISENQRILHTTEKLVTYTLPLHDSMVALLGNVGKYDFFLKYSFLGEVDKEPISIPKITVKTELYDVWQDAKKNSTLVKTPLMNGEILEADYLERTRNADFYYETFFAFTNKMEEDCILSIENVKINDVSLDMTEELNIPAQSTVLYLIHKHVSELEIKNIKEIRVVTADFHVMDCENDILVGGTLRCSYDDPIPMSQFK